MSDAATPETPPTSQQSSAETTLPPTGGTSLGGTEQGDQTPQEPQGPKAEANDDRFDNTAGDSSKSTGPDEAASQTTVQNGQEPNGDGTAGNNSQDGSGVDQAATQVSGLDTQGVDTAANNGQVVTGNNVSPDTQTKPPEALRSDTPWWFKKQVDSSKWSLEQAQKFLGWYDFFQEVSGQIEQNLNLLPNPLQNQFRQFLAESRFINAGTERTVNGVTEKVVSYDPLNGTYEVEKTDDQGKKTTDTRNLDYQPFFSALSELAKNPQLSMIKKYQQKVSARVDEDNKFYYGEAQPAEKLIPLAFQELVFVFGQARQWGITKDKDLFTNLFTLYAVMSNPNFSSDNPDLANKIKIQLARDVFKQVADFMRGKHSAVPEDFKAVLRDLRVALENEANPLADWLIGQVKGVIPADFSYTRKDGTEINISDADFSTYAAEDLESLTSVGLVRELVRMRLVRMTETPVTKLLQKILPTESSDNPLLAALAKKIDPSFLVNRLIPPVSLVEGSEVWNVLSSITGVSPTEIRKRLENFLPEKNLSLQNLVSSEGFIISMMLSTVLLSLMAEDEEKN